MSDVLGALSVGLTCLIGLELAVIAIGPDRVREPLHRRLALGLAPLLGAGWVSLLGLPLLVSGLYGRSAVACVLVLSPLALLPLVRSRTPATFSAPPMRPLLEQPHARAFLCVSLLAASAFVLWTVYLPYGRWDAYTFWNQRALQILTLGDQWRSAFDIRFHEHVSYPLLLPLVVLQGYTLAGEPTVLTPILFAAATCAGIALVAMSALSLLVGRADWSAAALTVGAPAFARQGAQQYADVPLAHAILATIAILMLARRLACRRLSLLAGVLASLAAFTKNEGVIFLLLVAAAAALGELMPARGARVAFGRLGRWVGVGLLPIFALLVVFKTTIAGENVMTAGRSVSSIVLQALGLANTWPTLRAMALELVDPVHWAFLYPIALAGMALRAVPLFVTHGAVTFVLPATLVGYFGIYLVTPFHIESHLSTSLDRLLMHLWPGFAFCAAVAWAEARGAADRDAGG